MQRRKLLYLAPLASLALVITRRLSAFRSRVNQPVDARQQAFTLNKLASSIQTPADARLLVDFVANIFAEDSLPALLTTKLREQVARAEYAAVSDERRLIPENKLADAWNSFVRVVEAPQDNQVLPAELHNMRDAFFSTATVQWQNGSRNIWAVPGIYAVTQQGVIAEGCRAIESVRILWDLANLPDNLIAARNRVNQSIVFSDEIRQARRVSPSEQRSGAVIVTVGPSNPLELAMRNFVRRRGLHEFGKAVSAMLDEVLV